MKYKLELAYYTPDRIAIFLVNNFGDHVCWIYLDKHWGPCRGPDGFWFEEKEYYDKNSVWEEYHLHRDEYIAEAKKLLVKHML